MLQRAGTPAEVQPGRRARRDRYSLPRATASVQREPLRQIGRDGAGKRAARAVGIGIGNARARKTSASAPFA